MSKATGWTRAELGELVSLRTGPFGSSLHQSDYVPDGIPLINPMHISAGLIAPTTEHTVSRETAQRLAEFQVAPGDIVIGRRGEMGRCAVVKSHQSGWLCGTGSMVIRCSSAVLSAYLQRVLSSDGSVRYLNQASVGSTMANLNQKVLTAMLIDVPPVAEQQRIVDSVEEVSPYIDAGVAELQAAQKKLTLYRQSLLKAAVEGALTAEWRKRNPPQETGEALLARILVERRARWEARQLARFEERGKVSAKGRQETYVDPDEPERARLPALPRHWAWSTLDQLAWFIRNGVSQRPSDDASGLPILRISAVRALAVNLADLRYLDASDKDHNEYLIANGDLLATRYNGSLDLLGVVGVVRGLTRATVHPDKLIRIRLALDGVLGDWVEACAATGISRAHIAGRARTTAGQTGISGEDIKKMPIPLPPLAEQEEIARIVSAGLGEARALEAALASSIKQASAQRQNILRAAFSGQLVPQDPNDEPASVLLDRIRAERAAQGAKPSLARRPRRTAGGVTAEGRL